VGSHLRQRIDAVLAELKAGLCVTLHGLVPHAEAVQWMRESHVLTLLAGSTPHIRLSKISEYLAAGRPILAMADRETEGVAEVRSYGARVVASGSAAELEQALIDVMTVPVPDTGGTATLAHPHPLNRRTAAEQLARILDAAAARRP
jgi:hypothetical protein